MESSDSSDGDEYDYEDYGGSSDEEAEEVPIEQWTQDERPESEVADGARGNSDAHDAEPTPVRSSKNYAA